MDALVGEAALAIVPLVPALERNPEGDELDQLILQVSEIVAGQNPHLVMIALGMLVKGAVEFTIAELVGFTDMEHLHHFNGLVLRDLGEEIAAWPHHPSPIPADAPRATPGRGPDRPSP